MKRRAGENERRRHHVSVERIDPHPEETMRLLKEKKKRRKRRLRFILRLFELLLAAAILIAAFVLLSQTVFRIRTVEVEGNTILTDEEVEERVITGKQQKNGLYQLFSNLLSPKEDVPFADRVRVSLKRPDTVLIRVEEPDLVGYISTGRKKGKYIYFDDDGIVKEVSDRLLPGLIPVDGIKAKKAWKGRSLPIREKCAKSLLILTKDLKKYKIRADKISFNYDRSVSVQSGACTLSFGELSYLDEKVTRASYILPHLKDRKGTLHLEGWTPENTDIVFEEDK